MATLKYAEGGVLLATKNAQYMKSAPGIMAMEVVVDFTKRYSDTATGTYRLITSATDTTLEVFAVPAGMKVLDAVLTVVTPGTASCTVAVGDGGSTAGFLAASAADAAAGTQYGTAAAAARGLAAAGGYLYTSADTIDLLIAGANPGNLVVRLDLLVWQSNPSTAVNTTN